MSRAAISTPAFDPQDVLLLRGCAGIRLAQITSYLLTLAAFQRGLTVTFLRSIPPRVGPPGFGKSGHSAEVFRISDGKREVFFNRTATNLLNPLVARRASDKTATKEALARAGLRVPRGTTVDGGDMAAAQSFLSSCDAGKFVVKPLNASLGEGMILNLTAEEALEEVRKSAREKLVLEEYITGTELRVSVVGDRVVGALIRHPASVIGDGVHTIEELAAIKNAEMRKNPTTSVGLVLDEDKLRYLAETGRSISEVPAIGEKVVLSRYRNGIHGADFEAATHLLNDSLKRVCVGAAKVSGLEVTGIDLILSDNPETPGSFILELNERAHLGLHTFPSTGPSGGMAVVDAVIDHYFPETKANKRFNGAIFDYKAVSDALASTSVDQITLPQLTAEWQHFRINFRSEKVGEAVRLRLAQAGAVVLGASTADGKGYVLSALLSKRTRMFLLDDRALIGRMVPRLEAAIDWPALEEVRDRFRSEAAEVAGLQRAHRSGKAAR